MRYSRYATHPYKVCTSCKQELELVMFHKKNAQCYKSKCKICYNKGNTSFTSYKYPTSEMQKRAELNHNNIWKLLNKGSVNKSSKVVIKLCRKCGEHPVPVANSFCNSCRKRAKRAKENTPEIRKKKQRKKCLNLSNCYVKGLIRAEISKHVKNFSRDDIPDELVKVKRQALVLRRSIGARTKTPLTSKALARL